MHFLKPVFEHWAVGIFEKPLVDMNYVVGINSEEIAVVSSVVNLAEA